MAGTYKGATAVWFMKDTAFASSGGLTGVTGTLHVQSGSGSRTADQALLKNNIGDVVGEGYNNDRYEATFDWVPVATDAIEMAATYILPAPGSVITITELVNGLATFNSAAPWICDSSDWKGDLSSPRGMTVKIHRYEHSDISADAV